MGFKQASKEEIKKLLIKDFGTKAVDDLLDKKAVYVNSNEPAEYYVVSKELEQAFEKIKKQGKQPLFMGSFIMDKSKEGKYRASLYTASKIKNEAINKVIIISKAEQLFLYSRNVISKSVVKVLGKPKRGDILLILNEQEDCLGLGMMLKDALVDRGEEPVVKNLVDMGKYLRCER